MVELARERTARFGERAEIRQTDGAPRIDAADGAFDRFIATYVLDLLPEDEIEAVLGEAHRVLVPGGRLGVASLARGERGPARIVTRIWERIHRLRPMWVGGCRPIAVGQRLCEGRWRVLEHSVVTTWGVASEVVVAERA